MTCCVLTVSVKHNNNNNNNNNNKLEIKVMYRLYIRSIDRQLIREEGMFVWLSRGDVKAET
jgi:hypothetical protein